MAGFLYFDARADDARLTLALLRTAVRGLRSGGRQLRRGRRASCGATPGTVARGRSSATSSAADGRIEVRARVVVNATGVWTDDVRALGEATPTSLRPAKGVHVTVPASRFPADIAAVIPVPQGPPLDLRRALARGGPRLPRHDRHRLRRDLDDPRCTPEDVDYLLGAVNAVSSAELTRGDVTGVWAGLRPLLSPPAGRHISERTADLSRRHRVWRDDDGVVTVTGGKLTTYRKMAEDTVDLAVARTSAGRGAVGRHEVTSRLEGVAGARVRANGPWRHCAGTPPRPPLRHDGRRRARRSPTAGPSCSGPIVPGLPYLGAEVVYAAREEMAVHLDDVLARRTRASIQDARGGRGGGARPSAAILAAELGWDDAAATGRGRPVRRAVAADLAAAGLAGAAGGAGEAATPVTPSSARSSSTPARPGPRRASAGPGSRSPTPLVESPRGRRGRGGRDPAADRADAGRDWWPLAIGWAARGEVPGPPGCGRPADATSPRWRRCWRRCHGPRVPVTPGRRRQRGVRRLGPGLRRAVAST